MQVYLPLCVRGNLQKLSQICFTFSKLRMYFMSITKITQTYSHFVSYLLGPYLSVLGKIINGKLLIEISFDIRETFLWFYFRSSYLLSWILGPSLIYLALSLQLLLRRSAIFPKSSYFTHCTFRYFSIQSRLLAQAPYALAYNGI